MRFFVLFRVGLLGLAVSSSLEGTGAAGGWQDVFPAATDIGDGWIQGDWPGFTYTLSQPWYYSITQGWLYAGPSGWFYDAGLGSWIWTRADYFPHAYEAGYAEWLTYSGGSVPDRVFYHHWGSTYLAERPVLLDRAGARARGILDFAEAQQRELLQVVPENNLSVELYTEADGWKIVATSSWVSGFFPACTWLNYHWSGLLSWKFQGERRLDALEGEKNRTNTHDLGFMVGLPFSIALEMTGDPGYGDIIVAAAGSLATRYSPVVGAIRSWSHGTWDDGNNFTVIIDNMMNLELLLRGAALPGGNPEWRDMALTHARTTLREHVRNDGSTYHVVIFNGDTGAVKSKVTAQGDNAESTWSRGQAWALNGFALMFAYTGEADMRDAAVAVASYFIDHLPADGAVPWDFEVAGSDIPSDTSASAIAAAGLIRLAHSLGEGDPFAQTCLDAASRILVGLSKWPYLAVGTDYGALLTGGSRKGGEHEMSLIYGDYYLLEACQRLLGVFPGQSL